MHSQFWRFWTQIEIHPERPLPEFYRHGAGLAARQPLSKGRHALPWSRIFGGTGAMGNAIQPLKEHWYPPMLRSLDLLEIGAKAKVGAGAVVVSDVPSVTVVDSGQNCAVHGRKDEPVIFTKKKKSANTTNKMELCQGR